MPKPGEKVHCTECRGEFTFASLMEAFIEPNEEENALFCSQECHDDWMKKKAIQ